MKKSIIIMLLIPVTFFAQAPVIQWQKTYGGNAPDDLRSLLQTQTGEIIVAGSSNSTISGDKTQVSSSKNDFWILKVNNLNGNIIWQNSILNSDNFFYTQNEVVINKNLANGFLMAGTQTNIDTYNLNFKILNDTGLTVNSGFTGLFPICPNLSSNYGTKLTNFFRVNDSNYISGGTSQDFLSTCDNTQNFFIEKKNIITSANFIFRKYYTGNNQDILKSFIQTNDNGYILYGQSNSNVSGDKIENSNGGYDFWLIKIDALGNIIWQNTIGGNLTDEAGYIEQTSDGGFIIGGSSNSSISGDKAENTKGGFDYWILKINALGTIEWQKTIGGSLNDKLSKIKQTIDNGYIICGTSNSNISENKTENSKGGNDNWIVKLNEFGDIQWDKTIGGIMEDFSFDIIETSVNEYVLGSTSNSSISGDKSEISRGSNDYWIVKLAPESLGINPKIVTKIQIYPNPATNSLTIDNKNNTPINSISIADTNGRNVLETKNVTSTIDISNLSNGIYFVRLATDAGNVTKKLVKK
jgi:hypothetical protein